MWELNKTRQNHKLREKLAKLTRRHIRIHFRFLSKKNTCRTVYQKSSHSLKAALRLSCAEKVKQEYNNANQLKLFNIQ